MRHHRREFVRAGAGLLGLATLSGCLGDPGRPVGGSANSAEEDGSDSDELVDADVAYLQAMIPHHERTVAMAELAVDRADQEAIRSFASDAIEEHTAELETMATLLDDGGYDVPGSVGEEASDPSDGTGQNGGDGTDRSESDADGSGNETASSDGNAVSAGEDEQLADLGAASGIEFDLRYVDATIVHYREAIGRSSDEMTDGNADAAVDLATSILVGYNADVDSLRQAREQLAAAYDGDYEKPDGVDHGH